MAQGKSPIPLGLTGGQCIVTPALEPVIGWTGGESARAPQPLMFSARLLEPSATTSIAYACNLPAPRDWAGNEALSLASLEATGSPSGKIERSFEAEFLAASLPGGQAAIVSGQDERRAVKFRWICVTAHASIGAVWRCFVRTGAGDLWNAIAHDYVFEAGGSLLNPPGDLKITLEDRAGSTIDLSHPDGMLTCFSCQSGRVKVTRLHADGWAERELLSLHLHPDRCIVARFSDGTQMSIAVAADARLPAALAA